jgi:PEP-CTERM motif
MSTATATPTVSAANDPKLRAVPEPASLGMLAIGLGTAGLMIRRSKVRTAS